jgi:hypothetical protein
LDVFKRLGFGTENPMLSKAKIVSYNTSKQFCIVSSTVYPSEIHSEKSGKEI